MVLAIVLEAQQRGVFHPHVILGYRTGGDRAALDTFRSAVKEARGRHGFGTGPGSFDAGQPDRFSPSDAARYVTKCLRPDGAKTSFVPLLRAIDELAERDPVTGRSKVLVRPVYVSPQLTRRTGVTMGFLRFRRFAYVRWRLATGKSRARWARLLASPDELIIVWKACQRLRASQTIGADPPAATVPVAAPRMIFEQLRLISEPTALLESWRRTAQLAQ